MARDIYLVTHTQSEHHVRGLGGGWYDTALTALGRRQAAAVADALAETVGAARPFEIFGSDLLRAAQTAEAIAARLAAPAVLDARLRERNYGQAGGRPLAWARERRIPPPPGPGRLDHRDGFEGAESMREFLTRLYRGMDAILESPSPTQIIVTHGFAMTGLIAAWIRMPFEAAAGVNFRSSPGGVTHLREDDDYLNRAVVSLNDTTHLERCQF